MSSHTQPQNVQVALSIIERVMNFSIVVISLREMISSRGARGLLLVLTLSIVRTGRRNRKHSPQRAALKTAAHPTGHEPPGFDFCPGCNVGHIAVDGELQRVHADQLFVAEFL